MKRPLFATTRNTGLLYVNSDNRYEAYIIICKQLWDFMLTIVLLQWFNLNSLLTGPELISDTYLALFLAQLQQEGVL